MKTILLLLLSAISAFGQCSSIQTGVSYWGGGQGYIDWHGFVAGSQDPTHPSITQTDITSAPVASSSTHWMQVIHGDILNPPSGGTGVLMTDPIYQTDGFGDGWYGQTFHYVHGNTQRRRPIQPYDNGEGAGTGDPGTVPVPLDPAISNYMGPNMRPYGVYLPVVGSIPNGDKQLHVIDVDNCIEYDYYSCLLEGSGLRCHTGGAYYLGAGDLQRPVGIAGTSNTSSVSGIPAAFGRLGYDEYLAALSGTPIKHTINVTVLPGYHGSAFTGAASMAQFAGNWDGNVVPFGAVMRMHPDVGGTDSLGLPGGALCKPMLEVAKHYGLTIVDGGTAPNTAVQENSDLWPSFGECGLDLANTFTAANFDVILPAQNSIVQCIGGYSGCPDSIPTGSAPSVATYTINGASSATVTLSGTVQTQTLAWTGVTGVTDLQGTPIPMRNISWGRGNRFGPGWIVHDNLNITVCSGACDFNATGTYPIQLYLHNRFGITTQTVTLTVE